MGISFWNSSSTNIPFIMIYLLCIVSSMTLYRKMNVLGEFAFIMKK